MDKRYQVFISSTFVDLVDERREVMQALLEMDCMPAGMELFPAGNEDQWTLIKGVIEQSDYYLVILGGRYGSMTEEGISYTEKEYDYAVELGIPVMGFVIAAPDNVPVGKTDKNEAAAAKLDEFRAKVQTRMTKDWKNAEDLGSKVTRGLMHLIKNNPRPGWVRGDHAMTPEVQVEIAELEAKVAKLEKKEIEASASSVALIDRNFAHGQEVTDLEVIYTGYLSGDVEDDLTQVGSHSLTWDAIFDTLGPSMLDEATERALRAKLNSRLVVDLWARSESWTEDVQDLSVDITDESWGSVVVQLRALGLITNGSKRRPVSDKAVYWKLTQAGDDYLVSLRAVPSAAKHQHDS
ncbi:DUF4062 domain-containing protein [Microbacterium esteraromaticum]|uniref:DUF4062 domain-containing protein n=1 Tax=Microbacterium esteraromaticum TaxID=57043 RepID=UPI001CD69A6D|nr:DUF4062 domain-containing protein [Microbacterium esteraromaticum]MCA1307992.1 DUF4062 domain-containing protein [Microbacterium esteraromaticum]